MVAAAVSNVICMSFMISWIMWHMFTGVAYCRFVIPYLMLELTIASCNFLCYICEALLDFSSAYFFPPSTENKICPFAHLTLTQWKENILHVYIKKKQCNSYMKWTVITTIFRVMFFYFQISNSDLFAATVWCWNLVGVVVILFFFLIGRIWCRLAASATEPEAIQCCLRKMFVSQYFYLVMQKCVSRHHIVSWIRMCTPSRSEYAIRSIFRLQYIFRRFIVVCAIQ